MNASFPPSSFFSSAPSTTSFQQFDYNSHRVVFIVVIPLRVHRASMGFHHNLQILAIISSTIFFLPIPLSLLSFWDSNYMYDSLLDSVPQFTEALSFLQFFFFPFSVSDWIISIAVSSYSLVLFVQSNLLLISTSEFLISHTTVLSSRSSNQFFICLQFLCSLYSCSFFLS